MGLSKPSTPTPPTPKPVQVVPNGTTIQYVQHIEQQPTTTTFSNTFLHQDDIILQEVPDTVLSYDGNTLDFGASAANHLDLAASLNDLESLLNPWSSVGNVSSSWQILLEHSYALDIFTLEDSAAAHQ